MFRITFHDNRIANKAPALPNMKREPQHQRDDDDNQIWDKEYNYRTKYIFLMILFR